MDTSKNKGSKNDDYEAADPNGLQGSGQLKNSPKIKNSQEKGIKKEPWKLRKTGMFYKMVTKAIEERDKELASEKVPTELNYSCWLYAPPSSHSMNMEDPAIEAPQNQFMQDKSIQNHENMFDTNEGQCEKNEEAWLNVCPLAMIHPGQVKPSPLDINDAPNARAENGIGRNNFDASDMLDMSKNKGYENDHDEAAGSNGLQGSGLLISSSEIKNGQEKGNKKEPSKLRKPGMFYKMVEKAMEEREELASEKVAKYRTTGVGCIPPQSSHSVNKEDFDPEAPQN